MADFTPTFEDHRSPVYDSPTSLHDLSAIFRAAAIVIRFNCTSTAEIQTLGYVGCYGGLARLLAPWRVHGPTDGPVRGGSGPVASVFTRHLSPQIAAALLGQPRTLLTERQAEMVDALKAQCPGFTTMRRLVLSFRTILRVGKVRTLRRWMARASATQIGPIQRFVRKLEQDLGAVEGAVRERWSNGPVEGHINRLKMLRRQMYGRAGVELLRARVLPLSLAANG